MNRFTSRKSESPAAWQCARSRRYWSWAWTTSRSIGTTRCRRDLAQARLALSSRRRTCTCSRPTGQPSDVDSGRACTSARRRPTSSPRRSPSRLSVNTMNRSRQKEGDARRVGLRGRFSAITAETNMPQKRICRRMWPQTVVQHRPVPHAGRKSHRERPHRLLPTCDLLGLGGAYESRPTARESDQAGGAAGCRRLSALRPLGPDDPWAVVGLVPGVSRPSRLRRRRGGRPRAASSRLRAVPA